MAVQRNKRSPLLTILVYAGLLIGLIFAGFPILWMLASSLKSNMEIFALPPRLLPKVFTFEAYTEIFKDPVKIRFFINSYLVAGLVTILTLIIAVLAAYGFSRYSFKFKGPANIFIISTQTVPPITLLIPYFGMVVSFGIFDTYMALILTYDRVSQHFAARVRRSGDGGWRIKLDCALAGCNPHLGPRDCGHGGLYLLAGVERVFVRSDLDQVNGPQDCSDWHPITYGTARI
jgi:ABC-type sulfate transport system permease component